MSTNRHFTLPVLRYFDVSPNISASNGRRNIKILPLEPLHWEESNGSCFILLRYLDAEIFGKTSKWCSTGSVKCWFVDILSIISAFRHRRSMKQLPFDSLNATVLMVIFLDFYDHWMLRYLMKKWVTQYRNGKNANLIDVLFNNLAPNGHRKVKILPFNCHIKRNRIIVFIITKYYIKYCIFKNKKFKI